MNIKRALIFGVMFWAAAFVVISVLMFTPWFADSQLRIQATWWILEIPIVLLLAKWYFKQVPPTIKNGAIVGLIGLATGVILDVIITVPFFIKSYSTYFGNEIMYIGFILGWLVCVYASFEFDGTYTKPAVVTTSPAVDNEKIKQ